jgi:hypothetical protein
MRKSRHSRHRPAIKSRAAKSRISDKIAVLRREGKSGSQAAGMAYSMERSKRLRKGGKYIHKRKSTSR